MSIVKDKEPVVQFYRLCQFVLYILYKAFFSFQSFGSRNVPADSRGVILAPNHSSHLDPPIMGISLKKPITYLAKEYLFQKPVLGTLLNWLGVLPIKSEADDFKSMRQLLRALKNGRQIVIFPEGTRSTDGELRQPEGGVGFLAIKSASYVVPVYIKGTFGAWPKGQKFFKPHKVEIHYGKAFVPAEDETFTKAADPYMAVSQKIMADIKQMKLESETKKFTQEQVR